MTDTMELMMFDEAAEALRALVPTDLGPVRVRARRYGLKVWFATEQVPKEHYEAQVLGARHVPEATVLAIEIGFHSEHRGPEANDRVVAALLEGEATWRRVLGEEAVVGPFIGRPDDWRRVSETWPDPDLGDPDLAMEVATRLTDYVVALEPLLRARST